ncbi:MAG: putative Ig domain-containing protein [Ferruginibacter sp.]
MKKVLFTVVCFCTCHFIFAQKVEMPLAKFKTGDNVTYSYPVTDDRQWGTIKPDMIWETQGYDNYDGYAWYRFHITLPKSIKENSLWKDTLRINLAKADDACEVFFNGTKIGKSGSFPSDTAGYISTWNKKQEYHIAANSPFINWGAENVIAVKVYDGGGAGGMFSGIPYINMVDLIDAININNKSSVRFTRPGKAIKNISIENNATEKITGILTYDIIDVDNDKSTSHSIPVSILPKKKLDFTIPITLAERNNIHYKFEENKSHKIIELTEIIPYILTPPVSASPKINGAKIFGVRPGSPFLFKIPATGKGKLLYSVENLPEGLQVNKNTGIITGTLKNEGEYKMTFVVKNSIGIDKRAFTVKCGNLLALTPPMGGNSWNCWGLSINETRLKASAQAMIDKGLINHGWTYMNIDDGWEAETRNANGEIVANHKFPDLKRPATGFMKKD